MDFKKVRYVGFIGDVHGDWKSLKVAISKLKNADMIIQVGDFGYWEPILKDLKLEKPIYWIDGNHDAFTYLKTKVVFDRCEIQLCHENLFYIPRGTVLEIGSLTFGFLGGAYSIDKAQRREGIDWFQEELPTYSEYLRLFGYEGKIDVLVTHDSPTKAIENTNIIKYKNDTISKGNRQALQQLYDYHKIKLGFCGHYHTPYTTYVNPAKIFGLGCAPDCALLDIETMTVTTTH